MKKTLTILISILLYQGITSQTYFSEDFEPLGGTLFQNNPWITVIQVAHPDNYDWFHADFSGNSFAKVSNYNATTLLNSAMETWLISPPIDLSTATNPTLNFNNVKRYAGTDLVVLISTDYAGGSPSTGTWTDITTMLTMDANDASWTFVNSGNLDLSPYISGSPNTVRLAFQYIGGPSDGSTYEVDDILINEGGSTPNVVSIYDIQYSTASPADSPFMGQQVNTGGIVNYVRLDGTYYLKSGNGPWSGIYVYDTLSSVLEGDSITFTASVDEYYELTELKNISNLTVISSGNIFSSNLVSTLQSASEEYEGCLIRVNTATCTNANAGFGEWIIDDGSGSSNVDDFFFPFTPTLNNIYNVTGFVDYSFSNFKILPRDIDDIDEVTSIDEKPTNEITFYPNPVIDFLHIELNETANIKIIDLSGKVCFEHAYNQGHQIIDLHEFSKGNYIININENFKKLLIQ